MSEQLISVIIPAWNREKFIGEAIQSVLSQGALPIEIIVVDDGSTDSTAELARAFGDPVRVVRQEHQGIGAARNRGLEEAGGDLIAWLDSDDRWTAGSLRLRLSALHDHPEVDMVFGHLIEFHDPARPGDSSLLPYPGWTAVTLLCERAIFERVGRFQTERVLGEFVEWCTKARDLGFRSLMLPEVVGERRIHDSNTVSGGRGQFDDYVKAVASTLARRRARDSR